MKVVMAVPSEIANTMLSSTPMLLLQSYATKTTKLEAEAS